MVVRTSVGSSMQENRVSQLQWVPNDLGKNNITLDVTKAQILFIDLEWLGVGTVRTRFIIDGIYYLAHVFNHANNSPYGVTITAPYMTSARLASRYEISTTNTNSNLGYKLKQICSTVISEGGYEARSIQRHIGITNPSGSNISNNTKYPLIAIKLTDTSGNVGINGIVIPSQADIAIYNDNSKASIVIYQLILNPSISPPPTFQTYNSLNPLDPQNSYVSCWVNPSGTTYTLSGGTIINSGYITTQNVLSSPTDFNLQIGRNLSGANSSAYTSDTLVVNINALQVASSGTQLYGQLGWYEI